MHVCYALVEFSSIAFGLPPLGCALKFHDALHNIIQIYNSILWDW